MILVEMNDVEMFLKEVIYMFFFMKNKVIKNYYYQQRLFQYILIGLLQIFEFKTNSTYV